MKNQRNTPIMRMASQKQRRVNPKAGRFQGNFRENRPDEYAEKYLATGNPFYALLSLQAAASDNKMVPEVVQLWLTTAIDEYIKAQPKKSLDRCLKLSGKRSGQAGSAAKQVIESWTLSNFFMGMAKVIGAARKNEIKILPAQAAKIARGKFLDAQRENLIPRWKDDKLARIYRTEWKAIDKLTNAIIYFRIAAENNAEMAGKEIKYLNPAGTDQTLCVSMSRKIAEHRRAKLSSNQTEIALSVLQQARISLEYYGFKERRKDQSAEELLVEKYLRWNRKTECEQAAMKGDEGALETFHFIEETHICPEFKVRGWD